MTSNETKKHPNQTTSIVEPKSAPQFQTDKTAFIGVQKLYMPGANGHNIYTLGERDFGKLVIIDCSKVVTGTTVTTRIVLPNVNLSGGRRIKIRSRNPPGFTGSSIVLTSALPAVDKISYSSLVVVANSSTATAGLTTLGADYTVNYVSTALSVGSHYIADVYCDGDEWNADIILVDSTA